MQHLTVLTSKRSHLHDARGRHNWTINGAGLEFNHLVCAVRAEQNRILNRIKLIVMIMLLR